MSHKLNWLQQEIFFAWIVDNISDYNICFVAAFNFQVLDYLWSPYFGFAIIYQFPGAWLLVVTIFRMLIALAGSSDFLSNLNGSFNCQMQLIFIQFSSSENVNFSPLPTAKKVNGSHFKRFWHLAPPNFLLKQILSLYRVHQKSLKYHIRFSFILISGQRNSIHLTEWDPNDHSYR